MLNINNPYFDQMFGQIYPTDRQLNKADFSDTESKKDGKDQELIQSSTTINDPDLKFFYQSVGA